MTTPPTPEQVLAWRDNPNIGANADELEAALRQAIAERDESRRLLDAANAELNRVRGHMPGTVADWVHAHDNMQVERDIAREERDQALARVKELEAVNEHLGQRVEQMLAAMRGDQSRVEKAEARVAVLREAIKDHGFHPIRPGTRDTCMYCEALAPEDQAAEALLAERDRLKRDLVRMGAELGKETAEIEAERDKLKAKFDVAVAALADCKAIAAFVPPNATPSGRQIADTVSDALAKIRAGCPSCGAHDPQECACTQAERQP